MQAGNVGSQVLFQWHCNSKSFSSDDVLKEPNDPQSYLNHYVKIILFIRNRFWWLFIKSLTLFLIGMLFLSWTILQDAIHCQGALLEECHNPQLLKTGTLHKRAIDYLIEYNLILTMHTFYTFVVFQGLWKRPIGQTPQWNIFKLSVFLKENLWCGCHIVRRPTPIFHPLVELDISQIDVDFFQISVWEVWRVNAHVPNTFWYTLKRLSAIWL